MTTTKFKIGDRIRVYATFFGSPLASRGVVKEVGTKIVQVELDKKKHGEKKTIWAHQKQCRRLKKKKVPGEPLILGWTLQQIHAAQLYWRKNNFNDPETA